MINVTIYNLTTGEITGIMSKGENQVIDLRNNEGYINDHYDRKKYYIDITTSPIAKLKTDFQISINKLSITADNTDTIIISNVPNGTKCVIKSNNYYINKIVDDGEIIFTTNDINIYEIKLSHPQYKDLINIIQAV